MSNEVQYDPALCVECAKNNREAVSRSKEVGCFYCMRAFPSSKIRDWIGDDAVCPHCSYASILPDSEIDITKDAILNSIYISLVLGKKINIKRKNRY